MAEGVPGGVPRGPGRGGHRGPGAGAADGRDFRGDRRSQLPTSHARHGLTVARTRGGILAHTRGDVGSDDQEEDRPHRCWV